MVGLLELFVLLDGLLKLCFVLLRHSSVALGHAGLLSVVQVAVLCVESLVGIQMISMVVIVVVV